LATPNYGYEKRQRELEEKLKAKAEGRRHDDADAPEEPGTDAPDGATGGDGAGAGN